MEKGILYIVGTPIGNLKDITIRALEVLAHVDFVAAEDTRNTKNLLNHYLIKTPLISYYDHVESRKSVELLRLLENGKNIALVSDSGMPLICDPGYRLVQLLLTENIKIEVVPGPTAFVSALVVSGMPVNGFVFEGFFPRSPQKRRKLLRGLVNEKRTMLFYESPHRLIKMLHDVLTVLGDRNIVLIRELTKKFEERFTGLASEALAYFTNKGVKGEFVVILSGRDDCIAN